MFSGHSASGVEAALGSAVKAYLRLRQGKVNSSELYEVFGRWHPSVTPDLLTRIVDRLSSGSAGWDEPETPHWNVSAGRLYFAGRLVKQFRRPAPNQRRILDAFERVHWLRKIDNPFLHAGICFDAAAEAVRNTAEALNDGHLAEGLIRFGTGGNYGYVYWKTVSLPTEGNLLRSAPFDIGRWINIFT